MKRAAVLAALLLPVLVACRGRDDRHRSTDSSNWSVTAWGETFEVFPEIEPLVAGRPALANTHVTVLDDFSPLREGSVAAVLRDGQGREAVFEQRTPKRDGIFSIEIRPAQEGEFDLSFRVTAAVGHEEIPAGRVKVGSAAGPGGLVEPPKPPHGTTPSDGAQGTPFLKEQQWRTEMGTAWVREGALAGSISASARVVAPAGGEVMLTAAVDAMLLPQPWPHRGLELPRGTVVFQLVPKGAGDKSLAALEADLTTLEHEVELARGRAERLAELLKLDATSRVEAERASATRASVEARLNAARRDLEAARATRVGSQAIAPLALRAPWTGQVAEVLVSPGQSVGAGTPLARLVKPHPVWLDVALRPEDAGRLKGNPFGLFVRRPSDAEPLVIPREAVRLVSRAPEVDARTATVGVLLEVARPASELPIGSAVEAEIVVGDKQRGIVVPTSALIDDAGVLVAYQQVSGESFARREVRVLARQGSSALVSGLKPGMRLVTQGAAAIRRASLLSAGAPEGHVH